MKKNIIIAAIAAASALLLSVSCEKESLTESQNGIHGGAKTFTATIEQSLTKTTLTDAYKVNWTTGDKININGMTFKATADGTDATKATFAKDPETQSDPTGTSFKAIFPSTLVNEDYNFELPGTQTYSAGGFNAPMYAESTTQSLTFKNICAVLAIKVTSEDIATLKSIKVKADKKLHGMFTVASTTDGYKAVIGDDGAEEVVLSSSNAITLTSEGTTFYIAIPEQEYSYLKIYLSEDGTLYKRAMITKKAAGLGTIACNKIYNINYETNAVQIYANGPYWSTMNIGATTPTDYGWYFSWGNTTGYVYDATNKWVKASDNTTKLGTDGSFSINNYNNTTVSGNGKTLAGDIPVGAEYDAAYANWGSAWKMPTGGSSGQFKNLNYNTTSAWTDNYNSTGVQGRTFTGKTGTPDYSDITLFFPAAGNSHDTNLINANTYGSYWSSSLSTGSPDKEAYYLSFFSGNLNPLYGYDRYFGFSVRPVSD